MQAKQLKSLINIGLVLACIGLLISFPFKDNTIIGGILFAIFSASVIGGLADSFAVKAIFGQPLNIKWPAWLGTNIVARHRTRLVDELVNMVQIELLSPESIRSALQHKKISTMLASFLQSETGEQTVKQLLHGAIKEMLRANNVSWLLLAAKRLIAQLNDKAEPSKHVATIVSYIFNEKLDDTIIAFLVRLIKPLLHNAEFKDFIYKLISAAISKYEKDNRRRQLANQYANIDAQQLTDKLFQYVEQWLFEVILDDHPIRIKLKQQALSFVQKIEHDEQYAAFIDKKCSQMMNKAVHFITNGQTAKEVIQNIEHALQQEDESHIATRWSHSIVNKLQSLLAQTNFSVYDEPLLQWLLKLVQSKQNMIGNLVKEKLNQFSTDELISLVEEKAGRDLQYIRLNGTVIGGLIGGVLFLAQLVIGGGQ